MKAGSAWAIGMIDFVITIFAAVILYYVVISGMEEKLKTVGLLDGIGISDGQKRLYIYGENLLAGALAVPLGMGLGLLALFLSCRELNERFLPTYDLELAVSPLWLGAVAGRKRGGDPLLCLRPLRQGEEGADPGSCQRL